MSDKDWTLARERARDIQRPRLDLPIEGADLDPAALELARYHAGQAGVSGDIRLHHRAFQDTPRRSDHGCLVSNPPYGRRLGGDLDQTVGKSSSSTLSESARSLYASFPSVLARLPNWSHFILVADRNFERSVDRRADRRRKLYAGKIECTYFQFHGPRKDTKSRAQEAASEAPAFAMDDEATRRQAELFAVRLGKRARHLRKWPSRRATNCYRLYERDIKEIPLIVDRFGDAVHVVEIVFPKNRTEAAQLAWRQLMLDTASRVLGVPRESIFFKQKRRHADRDGVGLIAMANDSRVVTENGLHFEVNLSDHIDTGLFMDHRETRARIRKEARGTRFLNLFAYTGSFTVAAAAGGAHSSTSVDRSASYLDWARRNLSRNGFDDVSRHRLLATDCEKFLRSPVGEKFDLAVVDPPTFSNRKGRDDWSVQRDHRALLVGVLRRMSSGGVVYFSTNFKAFRPELGGLEVDSIVELTPHSIPEDFRNRRIHRCWRIQTLGDA